MAHGIPASVLLALVVTLPAAADEGQLVKRRLAEPERIQELLCQDHAWLHEDGKLASCVLAEDQVIEGQPLPRLTRVTLERSGRLDWVFLPATAEIQGYRCRGSGNNFMTGFYSDGRLQLCWLEADELIQEVPCVKSTLSGEIWRSLFKAKSHSGVYFYPDGRLRSCRLSRDLTLAGRHYSGGSRIELGARATDPTAPAGAGSPATGG